MRIPALLALAVVCGTLAPSLTAQDNVNLTVAVTTSDGAPVRDLKKSDFSVQDAGKPLTIERFVPPSQKTAAAAPLEPNEYTNIPDFAASSGAVFVVFDTIHTRYLNERDMRAMVLKFLARAAQAKHSVTLAILNDKGLHVYHDYNNGSDVLLAALVKAGLGGMKGGTAPPGVNEAQVAAEAARLTAFSKGDLSNPAAETQLLRSSIDMPLVMFQDIGHAASGLPGRKSLFWITNAVPFDIDPKTFQFVSPMESNRGVAVNGIAAGGSKNALSDAQIKQILPVWRESMRALFDGGVAVYPVEARASSSSGSDSFTQAIMRLLAQLTGGKPFYGSNDPFADILQISDGNTAGYVLGFAGEPGPSSVFHRLQVSASATPFRINAPAGYFPAEPSKSRAQEEIGLALQSSLQYTGIPFRVKFTGVEDSNGKKKVNLVISLAGDTGLLNEATRKVDLGIVAIATNAKGDTVGKLNEGAGGQFPPDAVAHIKELGFQLKRAIEVPGAGDFILRIVLRDNQTGRMGSLIAPMNVK